MLLVTCGSNQWEQVKKVAKDVICKASIVLPILTLILALIVMKVFLPQWSLQTIYLKILPFLVLGIFIQMSGTYYFSILRGMREFKFLATRNFISSFVKIALAILLAFTPLGIIGVWISYLTYCYLQKYLSKRAYRKLEREKG